MPPRRVLTRKLAEPPRGNRLQHFVLITFLIGVSLCYDTGKHPTLSSAPLVLTGLIVPCRRGTASPPIASHQSPRVRRAANFERGPVRGVDQT